MGSLSSYKPSTLLIEIPDHKNIDDKLGVRHLGRVNGSSQQQQQHQQQNTNITRGNNIQRLNDNGLVIYAQPKIIKKNPHQQDSERQLNGSGKVSAISAIYLNKASANMRTATTAAIKRSVATRDGQVPPRPQPTPLKPFRNGQSIIYRPVNVDSDDLNAGKFATMRPNRTSNNNLNSTTITTAKLSLIGEDDSTMIDIKSSNYEIGAGDNNNVTGSNQPDTLTSNWSNGMNATSDLLF